jgi:hypothetical protein
MKGIMERRRMRMRGSPLMATKAWRHQGLAGLRLLPAKSSMSRGGRAEFWSREKEMTEGEGTEERGFGKTKIVVVACPYATAWARAQGKGRRGRHGVRHKAACPPRFSNKSTNIYIYIYIHSFAKIEK